MKKDARKEADRVGSLTEEELPYFIERVQKARTIKDLAALSGYSTATVSRVLKKDPRVKEETRAIVEALVAETGFVPDRLSQSLANIRWSRTHAETPAIALVQAMQHIYIENAVKEAAEELHYKVTVFNQEEFKNSELLIRMLRARGINAVIINTMSRGKLHIELPEAEFITVNCGTGQPGLRGYHTVDVDLFSVTLQAWHRAVEAGGKRIGFAYIRPQQSIMEIQIAAVVNYLMLEGKHEGISLFGEGFSFEPEPSMLRDFVRKNELDCVIVRNDGFYWALVGEGVKIPEEVRLVSLLTSSREKSNRIAGYVQLPHLLGRESVRLLHRMVQRRERGQASQPLTYRIEPIWKGGESLPAPTED